MYLRMLLEYLVVSKDSPFELAPEEGEDDESSNSNPFVTWFNELGTLKSCRKVFGESMLKTRLIPKLNQKTQFLQYMIWKIVSEKPRIFI